MRLLYRVIERRRNWLTRTVSETVLLVSESKEAAAARYRAEAKRATARLSFVEVTFHVQKALLPESPRRSEGTTVVLPAPAA
jgi:hypothetical protein